MSALEYSISVHFIFRDVKESSPQLKIILIMTGVEREHNYINNERENNMKEQSKLCTQKRSEQVSPLTVVCVGGCSSMPLVVS
jgi:hypothetical protein